MAAILYFTRKRSFPQGGFGWGFMCVLHGPTESNSVEKPLLTFLSIKTYLLPGLIGYTSVIHYYMGKARHFQDFSTS